MKTLHHGITEIPRLTAIKHGQLYIHVVFKVLVIVTMRSEVLLVVMPYVLERDHHFLGTYFLHLQSQRVSC
jgi:hypothetical protein